MRRYLLTYLALMSLLGLTLILAYVPMGSWNFVVSLLIAATKAALVLLVFMDVIEKRARVYTLLAVCIWYAIFASILLSDYLSRGFVGILGK